MPKKIQNILLFVRQLLVSSSSEHLIVARKLWNWGKLQPGLPALSPKVMPAMTFWTAWNTIPFLPDK